MAAALGNSSNLGGGIGYCSALASSTTATVISKSEMEFILDGCRDDCRIDGRKCTDYRTYSIITGISKELSSSKTAEQLKNRSNTTTSSTRTINNETITGRNPPLILSNGSARIISASDGNNLHMLCSVRAEIVTPAPSNPNVGVVELHVEGISSSISTMNNNNSTTKRRRIEDEIQATLSKLLLNYIVDIQSLCIVPEYYCWKLNIDLFLLTASNCGSIIDSASHVIRAAVQNTLLPSIQVVSTSTSSSSSATALPRLQNQQDQFTVKTATQGTTTTTTTNIELVVDGDITAARPPIGADSAPIVVTVSVMKCVAIEKSTTTIPRYVFVLDTTAEEEACSYARIHVTIVPTQVDTEQQQSTVCSISKTGYGSLSPQLLPSCIATAITASEQLFRTSPLLSSLQKQQKNHQQYQPYTIVSTIDGVNSMLLQEQFLIQ
jgi:exosome complex RNA-binding protein Rrp42 (RNase PH superfamily)